MPLVAPTGQRIRERRMALALKQADLAARAGISASYLNLIEHDRRRIGGALLVRIADELKTSPAALTEGAAGALVTALRDAAEGASGAAELDATEDFAQRFPGWADMVAAQAERIRHLDRTVEQLTDRLANDPFLSTSLHEVLSTVTAIRSAASILTEPGEIDPTWQARFIRNIRDDSHRLGEGAEALVRYLDAADDAISASLTPTEEFERALETADFHVDGAGEGTATDLFPDLSPAAAVQADAFLTRARADAKAMPIAEITPLLAQPDPDPTRIAQRFGVSLSAVLRRWALLPPSDDRAEAGLVICDMSGAILFRKPLPGFPLPRFGSVCPLWPLFQALAKPMQPIRQVIELGERAPDRFLAYAVADPITPAGFEAPAVFQSVMLLLPDGGFTPPAGGKQPVGTTCRICTRAECAARRETSVLGRGM